MIFNNNNNTKIIDVNKNKNDKIYTLICDILLSSNTDPRFDLKSRSPSDVSLLLRYKTHINPSQYFESIEGKIKYVNYLWDTSLYFDQWIYILKTLCSVYEIKLEDFDLKNEDLAFYNFGLDPNIIQQAECLHNNKTTLIVNNGGYESLGKIFTDHSNNSLANNIKEIWDSLSEKKKYKYYVSDKNLFRILPQFLLEKMWLNDIVLKIQELLHRLNLSPVVLYVKTKSYYVDQMMIQLNDRTYRSFPLNEKRIIEWLTLFNLDFHSKKKTSYTKEVSFLSVFNEKFTGNVYIEKKKNLFTLQEQISLRRLRKICSVNFV